jgi:hypothetical protein
MLQNGTVSQKGQFIDHDMPTFSDVIGKLILKPLIAEGELYGFLQLERQLQRQR